MHNFASNLYIMTTIYIFYNQLPLYLIVSNNINLSETLKQFSMQIKMNISKEIRKIRPTEPK